MIDRLVRRTLGSCSRPRGRPARPAHRVRPTGDIRREEHLWKPGPVTELVARSRRLGSDPRTTNYGGGNTSAKGWVSDPASGDDVEVVWVKGSGGDLAALQPGGLAVLRRDRVEGLRNVYRGVEHEDEMVTAFDFCLHGRPQAAPSIDTSMHALVAAQHVDHLHPDAGIAIATAVDGERLTSEIFGGRVLWHPLAPTRFPAGSRYRRGSPAAPGGDRVHPRRAWHHGVGRDQRRVRGQVDGDHLRLCGTPR